LLTLPDTLTELDLLLPPDPTILSQNLGGRDTTLLSNAFDLSMEYGRGLMDEDDPLSQFQNEDDILDFALEENDRSFSIERGRDAASINIEDEFGSVRGLNEELDFGLDKPSVFEEDDGLGGGFGDNTGFGDLDFGFGDDLPIDRQESVNGTFPLQTLWYRLGIDDRICGCFVETAGSGRGHARSYPHRRQTCEKTKTSHRRFRN
jgi:hypothetical protein